MDDIARSGSLGCALSRDCNWVVDSQGTNACSLTRMLMSFIAYLHSRAVISVVAHESITTGNFAKAGARGRHLCLARPVLGKHRRFHSRARGELGRRAGQGSGGRSGGIWCVSTLEQHGSRGVAHRLRPEREVRGSGAVNVKTHDLSLMTASVCRSRCESQRLHDGVVQIPPHLLNLLILSSRMHAICEEDHKQLPVGIDPDRSSGESRVPETMF